VSLKPIWHYAAAPSFLARNRPLSLANGDHRAKMIPRVTPVTIDSGISLVVPSRSVVATRSRLPVFPGPALTETTVDAVDVGPQITMLGRCHDGCQACSLGSGRFRSPTRCFFSHLVTKYQMKKGGMSSVGAENWRERTHHAQADQRYREFSEASTAGPGQSETLL